MLETDLKLYIILQTSFTFFFTAVHFTTDVNNKSASRYMNFQYLYVEKNMLLQKHKEA